MTIAITPFEGLCGFRPLAEIAHFFSNVPSLRKLVGEDKVKNFESTIKGKETSESDSDVTSNKKALQDIFNSLMSSSENDVKSANKQLQEAAKSEGSTFAGEGGPSNTGDELAELVQRCNGQFPDDIGLFVIFFLNFVKLAPGEAMFLKADDIHAYISGGEWKFLGSFVISMAWSCRTCASLAYTCVPVSCSASVMC